MWIILVCVLIGTLVLGGLYVAWVSNEVSGATIVLLGVGYTHGC